MAPSIALPDRNFSPSAGCWAVARPDRQNSQRAIGLPARYVIHTVGPVWNGGDNGEHELLASCYRSCFAIAREHGLPSLAFPAISCGIYRFPVELAVEIAMRETVTELSRNGMIEKVISPASAMMFLHRTSGLFQQRRDRNRAAKMKGRGEPY